MDIRLNGDLITRLITGRGGVMAFMGELIDRTADGESKINKATIHRWMKGQLPKNPERFLEFAGTLDVDPFALLSTDEEAISAIAEGMLEIVQHENSTPAPLQTLREFFGRQKEWPPSAIASDYFGRDWHVCEFHHDATTLKNVYQMVELACRPDHDKPQVFHFAYQTRGRFAGRWLEYGFVIRHGTTDTLRHIYGYSQHMTVADLNQPLRVKTWFGQGPAAFRVASLHEFALSVAPKNQRTECLEFPA